MLRAFHREDIIALLSNDLIFYTINMLSLLVVAKNIELRSKYIEKICSENKIESFDKTIIIRDSSLKQNASSIGIEEIKNIQKKLFLMPIRSPMKAVIIEDAQMLTAQAQNALLKVLEEPPDRTIIILSAVSADTFIPTIISRCRVILLDVEAQKFSDKLITEVKNLLDQKDLMSISEALKIAENRAKDKEEAVEWCECVIIELRNMLLEENLHKSAGKDNKLVPYWKINAELIEKIRVFQSLRHQIKDTNINTRFAIENALLK